MSVIAIVQARMGSNRLPGKVMKDILGKPMLWYLINRLQHSQLIEKIVIAVPDKESDKVLVEFAEEIGIDSFAGSEEDVLDRYYGAAKKYNAETIVRITGDCPLIDPDLVDLVVDHYLKNKDKIDFVHNGLSYPDGIVETEVFSFNVLEEAWKRAKFVSEREHVTAYIWKNNYIFRIDTLEHIEDLSHLRLVVDDARDFALVDEIFKHLYKKDKIFHLNDILDFLYKNPHLLELNKRTLRNEGYVKSIENDEIVK